MSEIGRKIFFNNLQIRKGNKQKRIEQDLNKDLTAFRILSDNDDFDKVYDYLLKNKLTNHHINVNLFPIDMNLIGRYREVGFSNQLKYELRWHMKTFSRFADSINNFIKVKCIVDELILLNQYEDALKCLNDLEKKYGFSYWLLENRLFLRNKLKMDNKEEIIQKSKHNILTTILGFYDMKSSDEVSSRDYNYFTKREIAKFKRINPDEIRIISFYHYMIAPFSFAMDDENLIYILECGYNLPLFDRYLYIIDLCEYILLESKCIDYKGYFKEYIHYMDKINDPCVEVFRFMSDTRESRRERYIISDSAISLKNKYILGDIEACYQEAVEYIRTNVANVSIYNLYIEVCQMLGKKPEDIDVSDNVKILLKNLNSVYSIDENYNNSIDEVYKMCFCSMHSTWVRDIFNYIARRSQSYKCGEEDIAAKYTNMQKMTIETVCENLAIDEAIDFLNNYEQSNDIYVSFRKDLVEENLYDASNKCGLPALKILLKLKNSTNYADFEQELNNIGKLIPVYKVRYLKVMWYNMTFETYIEEGIDYFLHLFIQRKDFAVIAPMDKFMDYFSNAEIVDKRNLRVPIFYYIYTTYFNVDRRDELSYICEDFFLYNKVEKPSLMYEFEKQYPKEEVIFFLRYVCIPQIMGPVLLTIRSSKELDQERIDTCQLLRSLDPQNEEAYEQEIRDITHKLFINEGLNSIENSKIHVNTDGIKSRISHDLKSAFNNYIYYRNHMLDTIFATIKNIEGDKKISIITLDASQLFTEIVTTIRNEFVSSGEYGLDGYLSLNIRHGTLAGQLRAPLAKYNLLATYKIETDTYDIHQRWLYKLHSDNDRDKVTAAIIDFNHETDAIIEYLRKTLIQVSTEEKPTEGIFDYTLSEVNIKYWQTLLTETIEFEEFIDKIFDKLWEKTEYNLATMKKIIRDEIKQRYINAFAKLQAVMKSINAKDFFPEAIRWLNEAQNDIDAELEKICNWFKRSAESQNADFDLDLAFHIGLKMIQNIQPQKKFEISELNKNFDYKIAGIYLKNYWNIFYTLFDNVSKYATEEDGVKYICCDLKLDAMGVYIKMINAYDCSKGVEQEKNKLEKALSLINEQTYLTTAKQEGGSGITKIYKILSVDLDKKASIRYNFFPETNRFCIEIEGRNK